MNLDHNSLLNGLRESTHAFLKELDQRSRSFDLRKEGLLDKLFRVGLIFKPEILQTAFGGPSISLAAVDGTFRVKQIEGLEIISAAAVSLIYEMGLSDSPWLEKWPQQDTLEYHCVTPHAFFDKSTDFVMQEDSLEISNQIGKSLMRFMEYCALHDSMLYAQVVLRDGLFSSDYHALVNNLLATKWYSRSGLIGFRTTTGRITPFDIYINLFRIPASEDMKNGSPQNLIFEAEEQSGSLRLTHLDTRKKSLLKVLVDVFPEQLSLQGDVLELSEQALYSHSKIQAAIRFFSSKLFDQNGYPFIIEDGDVKRVLEAKDLDLLSVYKLLELFWDAKKREILLLGIAKDSLSNNFQSGLIEKFIETPTQNPHHKPPDKLFLEIYSAIREPKFFSSNWSTIEYDSFIHRSDFQVDNANTLPIPLGVFVKFYFQFFTNNSLRSDVITCERLLMHSSKNLKKAGSTEKRNLTDPTYKGLTQSSFSAEVALQLLLATSEPSKSIPEAIGHSYPLFEADKVVKNLIEQVDVVAKNYYALIFTDPVTTPYLGLIKSFREKRSGYEKARRDSKWKSRF